LVRRAGAAEMSPGSGSRYPGAGASLLVGGPHGSVLEVCLWSSAEALRQALGDLEPDTVGLFRPAPITLSVSDRGAVTGVRWPDDGSMGRIHLAKGHTGLDVVAHEVTHALFAWIEYDHHAGAWDPIAGGDESYCLLVGRWVREIYEWVRGEEKVDG
jgi:hypothetical protein